MSVQKAQSRPWEPAPELVVFGGSAGALETLVELLAGLGPDFGVPVIVVVHLPAHRPSALSKALALVCRLPVREAQDKERVIAGTVFLAPPDYHLLLEDSRTFALSIDEPVRYSRPSIDVLFESAAAVYGGAVAAFLLSGANDDGARGLQAVRRAGGLAVIHSPEEAAVRAMPLAAAQLCPDALVLGRNGISTLLLQLDSSSPYRGQC